MTGSSDATQADADAQSQADTQDDATQADAQESISLDEAKKLRSEAASLRKRLKDAETKAQEAEVKDRKAQEAKAKEQGEWQTLAEKRETDLQSTTDTLNAANAELETLRTYVSGDVEAITKAIKDAKDSPAAKALLDFHPGDDASATELLAWAQKAKPRLADLTDDNRTPKGPGFNPPASDRRSTTDEDNRARAGMRPRL